MTHDHLPDWPSRPALFLDLDGTLLEFGSQPDTVEPSRRFHELLRRLAGLQHGAVAFVSGRSISELDRLLAPHRFALAGVHGSERRSFDGRVSTPPATAAWLSKARSALKRFEMANEGVILEEKSVSVALHYRQRPDLQVTIEDMARELAGLLPGDCELLLGKMVVEIKPSGVDKGRAIQEFMTEVPFAERTPVFIGDDVTDEAGFRAVNALGGVSVKVNNGTTAAQWKLPDVNAVLTWLEEVIPE